MSETEEERQDRVQRVIDHQVELWWGDYELVVSGFAVKTRMSRPDAMAALLLMQTWSLINTLTAEYQHKRDWEAKREELMEGQVILTRRALEEIDGGEGWKP